MSKILVVEDDKYLANAYRLKLGKSQFDVTLALDGREALALLETMTPDLIILDIVLPNEDGFTILEKIKKGEKSKSIPVIIASNLGQKEDLEKAKKLGAVDYFVKSQLTLDDLVKKINTLLQPSPKAMLNME